MANLRTAIWDFNISTPQAIVGVCKAIPGDPIPLDGAKASRALRFQQVSLSRNGFPLCIIPSFSPSINHKELGSFALQSLIGRMFIGDWWCGLMGQFRPKKLITSIKKEVSAAEEWDLPLLKDVTKHIRDKSLYALGLCTQIPLTSSTSVLLSTEKHGEKKNRRTKAMLYHKLIFYLKNCLHLLLPDYDVIFESVWPELFIDRKGKYWEVPESISLDCLSLVSDSGLRYRFGLHKNSGTPQAVDSVNTESPVALLPGLCAKAAFSSEKSKDLWRQKETKDDCMVETRDDQIWIPSYNVRLKDPHSAISGIIGGTCEAWLRGIEGNQNSVETKRRGRFGADLFGSLCYTLQHGRFRKDYGDLSRIDARLDITSASAIAKKVGSLFSRSQSDQPPNELWSPRLNLIFQQQVAGPIVFRIDSRFALGGSSLGKQGPHLEDLIYSLNYSLRLLQSGKVVAWYSPKRKEGMVELRLFEF